MTNPKFPFELLFWLLALLLLFRLDPQALHFSLCPLALLNFSWCPGCGFGRSLALLLEGEFQASVRMHWFGLPGLALILLRIWKLSRYQLSLITKPKPDVPAANFLHAGDEPRRIPISGASPRRDER